jgi:hypothetical protein
MSKYDLLAAVQAHMVYVIMRVVDSRDMDPAWNTEMSYALAVRMNSSQQNERRLMTTGPVRAFLDCFWWYVLRRRAIPTVCNMERLGVCRVQKAVCQILERIRLYQ